MPRRKDKLGICQWFHYQDYASVERSVECFKDLGVRCVRTGISWADFHRPEGREWYRRQMQALRGFDVLLSVWHTPPSIAEGEVCAGPPLRLADYADFLRQVIDLYGDCFSQVELWNEPNNRYKWSFDRFDPQWEKFGQMIRLAAPVVKEHGKTTVLGGMIPVDPHWLNLMKSYGALEAVDVVAIHGFPQMWWPNHPNWDWYQHWRGWKQKVACIAEQAEGRAIWITETGLATWHVDKRVEDRFDLQCEMLESAAAAPAERVYWYSQIDLYPARAAIEGFHVDENEYHLGLVKWSGVKKPAYAKMKALLQEGEW